MDGNSVESRITVSGIPGRCCSPLLSVVSQTLVTTELSVISHTSEPDFQSSNVGLGPSRVVMRSESTEEMLYSQTWSGKGSRRGWDKKVLRDKK